MDCRQLEVKVEGFVIKRVKNCKFLGMIIDENLTQKPHIRSVENKLSRNIGAKKRVRYKINPHIALLLHDTIILPHCNIIWGSCAKTYLDKLLTLQKQKFRIIVLSNRLTHASVLVYKLSRVSKLTINDIHSLQVADFVYAYNNGLYHDYIL